MAKPRICPNCKEEIPIDRGFYFDKDLNLVCGRCGKVAFPVTEEAEDKMKEKDKPSTNYYSGKHSTIGYQGQGNVGSHNDWG